MTLWETSLKMPQKVFTTEELVEQYLRLSEYWFTDKENSLFGKREESRLYLLYWLEHGDEPEGDTHYSILYVLNNFQRDYLPHFKKVAA